jgi:hypothetical protein
MTLKFVTFLRRPRNRKSLEKTLNGTKTPRSHQTRWRDLPLPRREVGIELSADNSEWIRLSVVPAFCLMAIHQGHVSLDLETIEARFALDGEASSLSVK